MSAAVETPALPTLEPTTRPEEKETFEPGWLVVCWNDPVNFMVYVTHVFMKVFGWNKTRAERHMMEVHEKGRSVLTRESLERAEFYVHQLQGYGLQATMQKDEA